MARPNRILEIVLRGLTKALLGLAGLLFFWGGRAIHEFLHVERIVAEFEGMGLCVLSGLVAVYANKAADSFSMRLKDSIPNEIK
jgi:hypothetical protein